MHERQPPRVIVLFDQECGFCRWSATSIARLDRRHRVSFEAIQASADLLRAVPVQERLSSMHVVERNGRVWSGGAALTRMLDELPGCRPLAVLGRALPGVAETVYRFLADHRDQAGRLVGADACAVAPPARRAS